MKDKDKSLVNVTEEAEDIAVDTVSDAETEENDALKTFLERGVADVAEETDADNDDSKKKKKKLPKNILWVIISCVAVLVIVALIFILQSCKKTTPAEFDPGTPITLSVDENGQHQADIILNDKGKLDNNSYGTLIELSPSDIKQIDIENQSGTYTILAQTPFTQDETTGEEVRGATVYTLVGYEDFDLLGGGADTIANDCAVINFSSVADISGKQASDFGFDKPRATVKTQFTDGTFSTIIVGGTVPNSQNSYVMFGSSKTIYVLSNDAVDGFLFSVLDLMDLAVNDAAADADTSLFESVTLKGSAFDSPIEIRPNEDSAIDSSYVMISPVRMFVSEVEAANIAGAIRGLYADKAVCVNPSNSQLEQYGLKSPYVSLEAIYPDTTISLKASKPKDGNVYLMSDTNVIYQIASDYVPWVSTSVEKLYPDIVLDPNYSSLTKIVVEDSSGSYTFDVTTTTETVDTTDGTTEEVTTTTGKYNGERLDSDNFRVFYQNICNMQNAGVAESDGTSTPALTISLSYSTGRNTDVIKVYATNDSKYIAQLNGDTLCLVYKSYCTKFSQCVQDLINGNTVSSF